MVNRTFFYWLFLKHPARARQQLTEPEVETEAPLFPGHGVKMATRY